MNQGVGEVRGAVDGGILCAALVDPKSLGGALRAARDGGQRFVCLHGAGLEPDVDVLARLAEALAAEPELGGCGPVLLRDGAVVAAGGRLAFAPGLCPVVTRRPQKPERRDWLPGIGLYTRAALEECAAPDDELAPTLVPPLLGFRLARRRRLVCLPWVACEVSGELAAARGRALLPLVRRAGRARAWLAWLCFESYR